MRLDMRSVMRLSGRVLGSRPLAYELWHISYGILVVAYQLWHIRCGQVSSLISASAETPVPPGRHRTGRSRMQMVMAPTSGSTLALYDVYIVMAYVVMAYVVMTHAVMAYIVMADLVMAKMRWCPMAAAL